MNYYDRDFRERVIAYRKQGNSLPKTQQAFGVRQATILTWEKLLKEQGHLGKRVLNRKPRKIDPQKLETYLSKHPDAYQSEVAEFFGCSQAAVSKALVRLGYTRKKRQ